MRESTAVFFLGGLAVLGIWVGPGFAGLARQDVRAEKPPQATYVGVARCKMCHRTKSRGEIYDKWKASPHSQAFEVLGSDNAKEFGAARGVSDPQKEPKCLKCHSTAFGADAKLVSRSFKPNLGVQCETCHGPGSLHIKARMKAAASLKKQGIEWLPEVPKEEIQLPSQETCLKCHNEESPGYKEFHFGEFLEKIRHLNPNRKKPRVVPPKKAEQGQGGEDQSQAGQPVKKD
ncbi:MAG: multiheme c-type cytochrome [Planctomycetota bacterium]